MSRRTFAGPQVRRWPDGIEQDWTLVALRLRVVRWRRNDRCTAREPRQPQDGRLPDDADLVVRALALLEGFAAYPVAPTPPPNVCRLRVSTSSLHLGNCPTHRSDGRYGWASGPTGLGEPQPSRTARRERHATEHRARRRSRAAACRAIARRPTKTSLVSHGFKRSPRSISIAGKCQYRRKSLMHGTI